MEKHYILIPFYKYDKSIRIDTDEEHLIQELEEALQDGTVFKHTDGKWYFVDQPIED